MKNKLRIGILLDSNDMPTWSYKMLEEINISTGSEIVLIVKNKSETVKKKSRIKGLIENRKIILYSLFKKLDTKLFKFTPDAFALKNIKDIVSADTIEVKPLKTKFSDKINASDIDEIEKYNIDIFIRLGFRILRGDILKIAKYGIWSFHHGDNKVNRGGPPGFWEVLENWDETGVTLQILTENLDGGVLLSKSYSLTHHTSPNKNRNNYYWKALSFIPSKIHELYDLGEEKFFKKVDELNKHPQFYSNRLYTVPSNKEMLVLGSKAILKKIKSKINEFFYFNQWILLFKLSPSDSISTSFFRYKKIVPPKDRFWADPHVLRKGDTYYIFIEELLYSNNKGYISLITMDNKGNYTAPVKVLEKEYHLSYPFLIEDNGELYMIPETIQNNTIELYRCTDFPLKWELEKVLMDNVKAVDSTITFKDGKYWLFANIVRNKGASSLDELFLFSSEKLVSDNWVSHPQNPIISDVKQSRPAGSFFTFKEKLYRPSQNGSKCYGYGMKINEVLELTETNYQENNVDSITPDWDKNLIATHTINSVGNLTVIDALMKRRKF